MNLKNIKGISGKITKLTPIEIYDTEDIIALRNNSEISRYLSNKKPISLEDQRAWLVTQSKLDNDIYFKITDFQNAFKGTISIYNINNRQGEFGRFICINSLMSIEAELLLLSFAFEKLKLQKVYCKTVKKMKRFGINTLSLGSKKLAKG